MIAWETWTESHPRALVYRLTVSESTLLQMPTAERDELAALLQRVSTVVSGLDTDTMNGAVDRRVLRDGALTDPVAMPEHVCGACGQRGAPTGIRLACPACDATLMAGPDHESPVIRSMPGH